jgi:hypothetical protein
MAYLTIRSGHQKRGGHRPGHKKNKCISLLVAAPKLCPCVNSADFEIDFRNLACFGRYRFVGNGGFLERSQ